MLPVANPAIEDGQGFPVHFLYVDDQNGVRIQALKLAKQIGIQVENGVLTREELEGTTYRHEKQLRIWGRKAAEVTMERFLAVVQEWQDLPAIIVLDHNIDFGHMIVLGTDICQAMRTAGLEGVILIRSGNGSAANNAEYLRCKADGMLQKTVRFADLVEELKGWAAVAKGRAS